MLVAHVRVGTLVGNEFDSVSDIVRRIHLLSKKCRDREKRVRSIPVKKNRWFQCRFLHAMPARQELAISIQLDLDLDIGCCSAM